MTFIAYTLLIFALGFGGALVVVVPHYRKVISDREELAYSIHLRHREACETITEQQVTITRLQVEAASDFMALTQLRWSRDWWRSQAVPHNRISTLSQHTEVTRMHRAGESPVSTDNGEPRARTAAPTLTN